MGTFDLTQFRAWLNGHEVTRNFDGVQRSWAQGPIVLSAWEAASGLTEASRLQRHPFVTAGNCFVRPSRVKLGSSRVAQYPEEMFNDQRDCVKKCVSPDHPHQGPQASLAFEG